jgi:hypothetical protein
MTAWLMVPLAASMLMFACNNTMAPLPGPPESGVSVSIHGVVRFADGTPAYPAVLTVELPHETLATGATDSLGRYRMTLTAVRDSARVFAQEQIQPGHVYGAIHYDWVMTVPDRDRDVDLVLTHEQPF